MTAKVAVGVRYCIRHHGIINEDDPKGVCDFARLDRDESECVTRELFYVSDPMHTRRPQQ